MNYFLICMFYFTPAAKPIIETRSNFFRNPFFPSTIIEWNQLERDIRNSDSFNVFKLSLLKFFRPAANSFFAINNPSDLKLLTILRLSHLRYHKFRYNFQDSINPICDCGQEIETTTHSHMFYNDETWHSYNLPKEDPKNVKIM